jgi:hypothetical protein
MAAEAFPCIFISLDCHDGKNPKFAMTFDLLSASRCDWVAGEGEG